MKVTSPLDSSVTDGHLCIKGRFGFEFVAAAPQGHASPGVMAGRRRGKSGARSVTSSRSVTSPKGSRARPGGCTGMSRSTRRGIVFAAFAVAAVLAGLVIVPRIENAFGGSMGIHDAAALPEHIRICGAAGTRTHSSASSASPRSGCETASSLSSWIPASSRHARQAPAPAVAQDEPCDTVIYVRVGSDAYLDYALQGGP